MPSLRIAAIGTRDLTVIDPGRLVEFDIAVKWIAGKGGVLVTGAAYGADQRAARSAARRGGQVELILPWVSFECNWVEEMIGRYDNQITTITYDTDNPEHKPWLESVGKYHPAPHKLTYVERKLHARNYGIVHNVNAVIALPTRLGREAKGGTAQGLRVAAALNIPLFDLSIPESFDHFQRWTKEYEAMLA